MEGNKASTDGLGGRITAAGCQQQGQQEVNGEALGGLATHGTAGLLLSPDEDTGSTAESRGDRQHQPPDCCHIMWQPFGSDPHPNGL